MHGFDPTSKFYARKVYHPPCFIHFSLGTIATIYFTLDHFRFLIMKKNAHTSNISSERFIKLRYNKMTSLYFVSLYCLNHRAEMPAKNYRNIPFCILERHHLLINYRVTINNPNTYTTNKNKR